MLPGAKCPLLDVAGSAGQGKTAQILLLRFAPVDGHLLRWGKDHQRIGANLPGQQLCGKVLVDDGGYTLQGSVWVWEPLPWTMAGSYPLALSRAMTILDMECAKGKSMSKKSCTG